jgi:hypothetical protein
VTAPAEARPGAPPWLWFWIPFFLANLPTLWSTLTWESAQYLELERSGLARLRSIDPTYGRFDALRMAGVVVDWLAPSILVVGIGAALVPWLRRRYVERRYGLRDPAAAPSGFASIQEFIQQNAPGVTVMVNLARRETAFVYPLGYRRAALVVFGGLYKLWQSDRPAAEAILLHEIAHCRRADFLVLGIGSPLSSGLKYVFLGYLVFLAVPHLIVSIDDAMAWRSKIAELQQDLSQVGVRLDPSLDLAGHLRVQAREHGVGQLAMLASHSLKFIAFLVLPLAGIWAAELNADRLVVLSQGSSGPIQRGLGSLSRRGWWWRWPLTALTHPPRWLRRSSMRFQTLGLVILVTALPVGYFVRLLVMHAWASVSYVAFLGFTTDQILTATLENTQQYLAPLLPVWLAAAALIAAWPWAFRLWESWFVTRAAGETVQRDLSIYLIAAGCCVGLAALSFALSYR